MILKIYQSESDKFIELNSIGKIKYIGESFGVDALTDGNVYDVIEVLPDDLIRVVDNSGEDYLYSIKNPRPLDGSSPGGAWEVIEDYNGDLTELI